MYHHYINRANKIADEIELALARLKLAKSGNQPEEVNVLTDMLETLLNQYMDLRQEQKLRSMQ